MGYMDDNSTEGVSVDNLASSRAKNPSHIVELPSADTSEVEVLNFSGDPVIEANMQSKATQQAKLEHMRVSSMPSGPMNQSAAEAPLKKNT